MPGAAAGRKSAKRRKPGTRRARTLREFQRLHGRCGGRVSVIRLDGIVEATCLLCNEARLFGTQRAEGSKTSVDGHRHKHPRRRRNL